MRRYERVPIFFSSYLLTFFPSYAHTSITLNTRSGEMAKQISVVVQNTEERRYCLLFTRPSFGRSSLPLIRSFSLLKSNPQDNRYNPWTSGTARDR